MKDIRKLARVQLIVIPVFVVFKLIRPGVLNSDAHDFFKLTLLSLPNFFEAIIGICTLTGLGLIVNDRLDHRFQFKWIYLVAALLTCIYVTTQELKIHNLGGNNVYDPNDLIFSFVGLIFGYAIILMIKPKIIENTL